MKLISILVFTWFATVANAQVERSDLNADCREMQLTEWLFYSKNHFEEFMISELRANIEEFGVLNWGCVIREFESLSENTSVWVIPNGGRDGADVIRFKLDRSDSFLAAILTFGPGNSNGVFVAIFNVSSTGEVIIIRRGGDAEWLKFE